jgi:photosystem II stability/assembly factor-like uncharacterized protein
MSSRQLFVATNQGLITFERDEEAWAETGRHLSDKQITSVTANQKTILAGTTAGLFRSVDDGQSWQPADSGLTTCHVRWLTHHPDDLDLFLAGTEPANIFVSQDGGQTWQGSPAVVKLREANNWRLPYSPEAGCVRGFAVHGRRIYAAVEQGGLLRSDDTGVTWQLVEGATGQPRSAQPDSFIHPDVHSVAVHPASSELVYAATGGGLYRSRDGGDSWEQLYECYCRALWPNPAEPDHIIFGPADSVDRNGWIAESVDGGRNWKLGARGLQVPWPDHMVERFVQIDDRLFAILSNGQVIGTPPVALVWRYAFTQLERVSAMAAV